MQLNFNKYNNIKKKNEKYEENLRYINFKW